MFQAANTDLFNPFVPKAHDSESRSQLKLKVGQSWLEDFYLLHPRH